jgi:FixJ family two-component response regulator
MSDRSVVMIVDDHDSLRRAARRLIKSYGFAVDTFFSAEDFLASGRLDETACLVLDVHMPGLSGLVLQTRLNVIGYHISIVFITAFADDNTRAQALQHNAYGYLAKPLDEDDLLNSINGALRQSITTRRQRASLFVNTRAPNHLRKALTGRPVRAKIRKCCARIHERAIVDADQFPLRLNLAVLAQGEQLPVRMPGLLQPHPCNANATGG